MALFRRCPKGPCTWHCVNGTDFLMLHDRSQSRDGRKFSVPLRSGVNRVFQRRNCGEQNDFHCQGERGGGDIVVHIPHLTSRPAKGPGHRVRGIFRIPYSKRFHRPKMPFLHFPRHKTFLGKQKKKEPFGSTKPCNNYPTPVSRYWPLPPRR